MKIKHIIITLILGLVLAGTITYARIDNPESILTLITGGSTTAGSVIFSDGTNFAEDNSNFFWDDTNNRQGIGSTSPYAQLSIEMDGSDFPFVIGDNGTSTPFLSMNGQGQTTLSSQLTAANFVASGDTATSTLAGLFATSIQSGIGIETPFIVATGTAATSTIAGGLTVDTSDLVVDPDGGNVGIGSSSPTVTLSVGNGATATTTIDLGKVCIISTEDDGTLLYHWFSSIGTIAGVATSTTSCE
jgi:hypothetical protein